MSGTASGPPAGLPARLEVAGGIATITLSNPRGMNGIDKPLTQTLLGLLDEAEARPGVRVLLTLAEGPAWCAGGNVAAMASLADGTHDWIRDVGADVNALIPRIHESRLLSVAGVSGAVAGGGLGLMGAHDVVLATAAASFSFAYGGLGLSPDAGGSFFVVRDLGYRRALDLYLSNARLEAEAARNMGLISRIVADDAALRAAVAGLAAGPAEAIAETKRLMRTAAGGLLRAQLEDEIRTLADGTRGAEFREGLAAFLERRRPAFPGAPA
ncbi:MAG: enoyl-CoA hydratase [Solirubrobacterales bacterium]|nr:enoyl-CoA hydratase [Solirubrobacterales bacterium]